jgi:transcriptional regulator with XRE-family HTH domain
LATDTIGERMAWIRASASLSQAEFARKIFASRSYLSEVENGKGKPSIDMISGIATAFPSISLSWLLTGDGSPTAPEPSDWVERLKASGALSDQSLPTRSEGADRPLNEIGWPLSSQQERLLVSFVPIPPTPGTIPFINPFSDRFDKEVQRYWPYALSRWWISEVLKCPVEEVFLYHFTDDNFAPLAPRGSHCVICCNITTWGDRGLYWVEDRGETKLLILLERRGHKLKVARGTPSNAENCFTVDERSGDLSALGRAVWFFVPSDALLATALGLGSLGRWT